jgi:hypothetical protein
MGEDADENLIETTFYLYSYHFFLSSVLSPLQSLTYFFSQVSKLSAFSQVSKLIDLSALSLKSQNFKKTKEKSKKRKPEESVRLSTYNLHVPSLS